MAQRLSPLGETQQTSTAFRASNPERLTPASRVAEPVAELVCYPSLWPSMLHVYRTSVITGGNRPAIAQEG
jgi:hypothetical protein